MNLLILGSTGFLGSKVLDAFKNRNTIYKGFRTNFDNVELPDVTLNDLDVAKIENFIENNKVDFIIYALNSYFKDPTKRNLLEMEKVNFQFPKEILEILNRNKLSTQLLYFTSYFDDVNVPKESSGYALTKKMFTDYLKLNVHISNYKLLKISDTFGTWDNRSKIFNFILKNILRQKKITLQNPKGVVNLIYVDRLMEKTKDFLIDDNKFDHLLNKYSITTENLCKLIDKIYHGKLVELEKYFFVEERFSNLDLNYGFEIVDEISNVINNEEYIKFLKN